jgi:DNA-binding CsgD family transcriptional regulator
MIPRRARSGDMSTASLEIPRVLPLSPLTRAQRLVALMIGMGSNYSEVADLLAISVFTAKRHAEDAAAKIPGNLPTQTKLVMWVRGASLEALDGSSLRATITRGNESLVDPKDVEILSPVIGACKMAGMYRSRPLRTASGDHASDLRSVRT